MPTYDMHCKKCKKDLEVVSSIAQRHNQMCEKCRSPLTMLVSALKNGLDPFKPYVLENGVAEPTYIASREQRDQLFKEKGLIQKTYRQGRYSDYSRIFPVSGKASKGSGTRWTGDGLSY